MARTQRKDDILKSELPPALPLMALRSTIVYPLGTIAVQMGAPENLALLRAYEEEAGLIVALVACQQGLRTTKGAVGVGEATTRTVVITMVLIYVANYFMTAWLFA